MMIKPVICFGEIMVRLAAPGYLRLGQTMPGLLETTFAGAEANTAAAIAALGGNVEIVTAVPDNDISRALLANLRSANVGSRFVFMRNEGRFGLFFMETGSNQRAGQVLYDRDHSTFSLTRATAYPWAAMMAEAGWFHTTGISAGVSAVAARTTLAALHAAAGAGVMTSLDLNYRRKLWRWDPSVSAEALARRTLGEMLPLVDLVIGNPADLAAVAGLPMPAQPTPASLRMLVRRFAANFPRARWVALTLRDAVSATHNRWGAMLYCVPERRNYFSPLVRGRYCPYEITSMVDRVGTGDVFAGSLIHALRTKDLASPAKALEFAVAASCLAHTTKGDFGICTRSEVEALMAGNNGGMMAR